MSNKNAEIHLEGCNDGLTICGCSVQNWEDQAGMDSKLVTDNFQKATCEQCREWYLEQKEDENDNTK